MAEPEGTPINLNDWMKEQPVSPLQVFRACCSPTKFRRRLARMALFKRFTVEELERRYQKQQPRLSHKEDQAVRQTIEKFKNGWYVAVTFKHSVGTFYAPVSLLFTCLLVLQTLPVGSLTLPIISYIFRSFSKKDNYQICFAYVLAAFYPLLFLLDILVLLCVTFTVLTALFTFVLPLEVLLFMGGICWYRGSRLDTFGVFVYHCKLFLLIAQGAATKNYVVVRHTVNLTKYDVGAELTLPRASICRTLYNNPVVKIFKNLYWLEYSYGDIEDHMVLSASEAQMYDLRIQQTADLLTRAQRLA